MLNVTHSTYYIQYYTNMRVVTPTICLQPRTRLAVIITYRTSRNNLIATSFFFLLRSVVPSSPAHISDVRVFDLILASPPRTHGSSQPATVNQFQARRLFSALLMSNTDRFLVCLPTPQHQQLSLAQLSGASIKRWIMSTQHSILSELHCIAL